MKNLFVVLSFFLVLAASAQAKRQVKNELKKVEFQKEQPTAEAGGLKNITDLEKFMPLQPESKAMLQELFTTKFRMLQEAGSSIERRNIVSQAIESKLQSSVDGVTFNKIKANKVLFESLVH